MKLIELDSIKLSFKKQNIFNDFSYTFNDVGLYLLFGPSGSGKTTLLNILIGQQKIDSGKYYYKGNLFEDNIETNIDDFAYFTQSTYYIDYLTIEDNLKLCSNDSDVINYWLDYFSLPNILHKYPNELSGGEKQRLSLILGLIQNKKVFLLDEPTSSLDKAQAKILYECIKKLSKNVLVILVSHDSRSKEYCDEIIDFTNLKKYQSKMEITHLSKFIETKILGKEFNFTL